MNFNHLINMILRMLTQRAISHGLDWTTRKFSKKDQAPIKEKKGDTHLEEYTQVDRKKIRFPR